MLHIETGGSRKIYYQLIRSMNATIITTTLKKLRSP